jgi:hypothetical protein
MELEVEARCWKMNDDWPGSDMHLLDIDFFGKINTKKCI